MLWGRMLCCAALFAPVVCAWVVNTTDGCVGNDIQGVQTLHLFFEQEELLEAFTGVFHMSDGSVPMVHSSGSVGIPPRISPALKYTMNALGHVGVRVSDDGKSLTVCNCDLLKLSMLAVMGNYVHSPMDDQLESRGSLASVVVDVYSGRLTVVPLYSTMREYFLETLLVISVIVMARLGTTHTIVVTGIKR